MRAAKENVREQPEAREKNELLIILKSSSVEINIERSFSFLFCELVQFKYHTQ